MFSVCVLVFLVSLIIWGVAALRQRRSKSPEQPPLARWARRIAVTISALNLLFPITVLLAALSAMSDFATLISRFTRLMTLPLILPVAAAVLTIGAVGFTGLAWRNRYWNIWGRAHYTLVTLSALVFSGWLHYWNWLGWRF
jgi:hypothetical protein